METKTLEILVNYGNLINATVTDLQPQNNYSVNISAFTEYGRGPSSNILTVLTPARREFPSTVFLICKLYYMTDNFGYCIVALSNVDTRMRRKVSCINYMLVAR